MRRSSLIAISMGIACIACGATQAQTTSAMQIGGEFSCSSEGFNNPGKLSDGTTVPVAFYSFTLDKTAKTLVLEVNNASPIVAGACNPVLTDIYFNAPVEVTGMTLVSQSAAGGATPQFGFGFDSDLFNAPHPNKADGFGVFSCGLNLNGINPGIQNPSATQVAGGPHCLSPVAFSFSLQGDLTNVTVQNFSQAFSQIPPGSKPVPVRRQVPGRRGGAVTRVRSSRTSRRTASSFALKRRGPRPLPGHPRCTTHSRHSSQTSGTSTAPPSPIHWSCPLVKIPGPRTIIDEYYAQMLMYNAAAQGESAILKVTVYSNGNFKSEEIGDTNRLRMWAEKHVTWDGRKYLRFKWRMEENLRPRDRVEQVVRWLFLRM